LNKKFYLVLTSGVIVLFLSIGALLARTNTKDNSYTYLSIFSNVVHLVDANYVEEVDFNKVMDSALVGMVENLDPDSFYIKAADIDEYRKDLEDDKNKAGVGLTLVKRQGMVIVAAVEKGSSAEQNKMKPGDYIRTIDSQYVQPLPLYKVYHLLRGNPGTDVKVSIFRSALEKPEEFTLARRMITKPYTESYVVQPHIGYIRIGHLLPGVETEVENKLNSFNSQNATKLILDLRGCTEDDQATAVKVADLFVGEVPIVQISGRDGMIKKITGDAKIAYKGEVLLLVDFTTLGGAEVIAGALQDAGVAKTFGTRTFGRGGIQKLIPAGPNWFVLTTQKYLTPKGKMILTNGIEPTIAYKEDVKSVDETEDVDHMLQKAIDLLRAPVQKAA